MVNLKYSTADGSYPPDREDHEITSCHLYLGSDRDPKAVDCGIVPVEYDGNGHLVFVHSVSANVTGDVLVTSVCAVFAEGTEEETALASILMDRNAVNSGEPFNITASIGLEHL